MRRFLLCAVASMALCGPSATAQEQLKIKFRSRALLDAMVSGYGTESAQGYYRVEDFRVGFKATYGRYELKADIGLGGGKVAIKDLLLNYHFKNSVLAVGNAYEPFSMDMLISTADMRFHQSATSVLAFADSRKLGATYHYYTPHWYLATGIYTHNDINKIGDGQRNAFVSTSRAVWRARDERRETLLHLGGAFSYRTKEANTSEPPTKTLSVAGVTSMFPTSMMEASISRMGSEVKGVIEALYTAPRFLMQSEYFLNRMNRTGGLQAYRAHGGYVQGSFLIKGRGFEYDSMYGIPGRPSTDKAIELTARVNYTDMDDDKAEVFGGKEADFSLGVNFYLNKYLGLKLNGSYVWTGSNCNEGYDDNLFVAQVRLQYIF